MLQSLISLEDDQIEVVLCAVAQWCHQHKVEIDSPGGHRAVTVAVDCVISLRAHHYADALFARLNEIRIGESQ